MLRYLQNLCCILLLSLCSCEGALIENVTVEQQPDQTLTDQNLLFDLDNTTFSGDSILVGFPLGDQDCINIPFTNALSNAYTATVSKLNIPAGLSMDMYALVPNQPYGTISLALEGTPEVANDTLITFSLTANKRTWDCKITLPSLDDSQSSGFKISSVTLYGPIYASNNTYFAEDYSIKVSFIGANEGSTLKLTSYDGYMTPYQGKVSALESQTITESNSTVIFDLGANFFESMVNPDNIGEAANDATATITIGLDYDGVALDNQQFTIYPGGYFIWKGFTYGVYYDGNQTWLDRNLGAKSNLVATPTLSDNTVSEWESNFSSYGSYFQRGRTVGIPIYTSGNTISGSDDTDPYFYYNSSSTWEDGSWQTMPAELDNASDQTLWNNSESGGTNNPCPTGFRVPTTTEIMEMIEYVSEVEITDNTYSANDKLLSPLMTTMNLPLTGYIQYSGPTMVNQSSTTCGQISSVGFNSVGDGSQPGAIISASEGAIYLLTCEIGTGNSLNSYVKISSSGAVSTGTLHKNTCMPVRCKLVR